MPHTPKKELSQDGGAYLYFQRYTGGSGAKVSATTQKSKNILEPIPE